MSDYKYKVECHYCGAVHFTNIKMVHTGNVITVPKFYVCGVCDHDKFTVVLDSD